MNSHRNRTLILWLAALAILWGLLAPGFAANMAPNGGKTWVDVCLSVGSRLVAAATDDAADLQSAHPGIHCPFCVSEQDQAIAAASNGWQVTVVAAAVARSARLADDFLPSPARLHGPHPSRAPPRHIRA